jgi:hypothetical protein
MLDSMTSLSNKR